MYAVALIEIPSLPIGLVVSKGFMSHSAIAARAIPFDDMPHTAHADVFAGNRSNTDGA